MAQKTVVTLVDDVTGQEMKEGEGVTITIGWEGKMYELDVSDETKASMDDYYADILHSARLVRADGRTSRSTGVVTDRKAKSQRIGRIRQWARQQGMEIADRGRVNRDVVEAYEAANPQDAAA